MTSPFERLNRGEWVDGSSERDSEFDQALMECYSKITDYNTIIHSQEQRHKKLSEIVGYEVDKDTYALPPFRCDLGFNIILGKNVLINYNCTFLDTVRIEIGDNTMIGPDCRFLTAIHPDDPILRRTHMTMGKPISVGKDCWFGGGVTVLPGITIGDGCIIGAGSVVTKDVPDGTTVVGNPAKPIVRKN